MKSSCCTGKRSTLTQTNQKIQYAKGKSDTVAKLDGTYRMPIAAGSEVATTALQQSVFGAPPSSLPAFVGAPPPSLRAPDPSRKEDIAVNSDVAEAKGTKRVREEENEDEGAPMEEDSDAPMEASSDEDDD